MYGALPGTGRGFAFVCMFALSTIHIISKSMSVTLLVVTNPSWLLWYMSSDMGLYLAQKIARRDFIYFMPMSLSLALPVSSMFRVVVK